MTYDASPSRPEAGDSEDSSDLEREIERLRQRDEQARQLLYRISHDVRAPLRHIRGYASMLSAKHAAELSEGAASFLSRIIARVEVADALFEAVLQLSRAQRLEISDDPVALDDLVREASRRLADRSADIEISSGLPSLRVDARWVSWSIQEALTNACKFARPDGSPRVRVEAYLAQDDEPPGRGLTIADHGIGVDERLRSRAFDLFEREASEEVPGLGAGLAIVREVAQRHGGDAWFRAPADDTTELILLLAATEPSTPDIGDTP